MNRPDSAHRCSDRVDDDVRYRPHDTLALRAWLQSGYHVAPREGRTAMLQTLRALFEHRAVKDPVRFDDDTRIFVGAVD